jgi:hypothetical protein
MLALPFVEKEIVERQSTFTLHWEFAALARTGRIADALGRQSWILYPG